MVLREKPLLTEETIVKTRFSKLVLDKTLALGLVLITLPLSLAITAAIKLAGLLDPRDGGPVFYNEIRVSQGQPFDLIKFRIFRLAAVERIKGGSKTKDVENDPESLTAVGRILKKYGIDELPQLFSILRGDMSFVGPRPKPLREFEAEMAGGIYRGKVIRAGLTGPAQIMKGSRRTYEQEVAEDYAYIEKCLTSPWWRLLKTDLTILFTTIKVLAKGPDE